MNLPRISLLLTFFISGCFTAKQPSTTTKNTFTFEYSQKESTTLGSAKMLIAFVKPYYAEEFSSKSSELFTAFKKAIGNDIEELIISKGFSLKGPYESFDEMIFDDKKNTQILINIEISPRFTAHEGSWKSHLNLLSPQNPTYSYIGKVSLVGKININGVEPLTNEKIWSKSVSIPNVENIQIETSERYSRVLNDLELINDPGVYNALGKALMTQYAGILDKISTHFSVAEFQSLKDQIKELKSKKGY